MLPVLARASVLFAALAGCTGCIPPTSTAPQADVLARPVGTWNGEDSQTLGFPSDTGRFHVTWRCTASATGSARHFSLAVHSAVSGRPLHHLTDDCDDGTMLVQDDPRLFNLMVTANGTTWTVSVQELVTVSTRP